VDEAIVDANVLIRLLVDEPPELAARVSAILELASNRDMTLLVTSLTLSEVVYVLESVYKWDRDTVADKLVDLIASTNLWFPESAVLLQALRRYKSVRQLHFADAYVAAVALSRQHGTVISFDRKFRRVPELTLIQDTHDIE
jgi:predicted nucleic acid-binding protein